MIEIQDMFKSARFVSLLGLAAALAACVSQANALSIVTPAATQHPTATPSPTPSPTPFPTPDFKQSVVAQNGFLLSSSDDPDCQLPCWQGLQPGVSTREDVQRMFDETFGFYNLIDVFASQNNLEESPHFAQPYPAGMNVGGYWWRYKNERGRYAQYAVYAAVDSKTGILRGLMFDQVTGAEMPMDDRQPFDPADAYPGDFELPTIQEILQRLGTPDYVFAKGDSEGVYWIIYRKGISSEINIVPTYRNGIVLTCLNVTSAARIDMLFEPFEDLNDSTSLNALHQSWLLHEIEATNYTPIETKLGMTVEEFAAMAYSDDPCWKED
jgi:hypothetical protein